MSIAGDLTTSTYWEEVWAATPPQEGRFAKLRRLSQWKYDRMVRRLLDSASKPVANVLELGCAPGTMLQRIHRLRPDLRLSGIDYADEGCRTTAGLLKGLGLPPNVYHGDVRTARLPEQFDLVTSYGLIEHFDDPAEIVRCHARFCRVGGSVAIALPTFTHPVVHYYASRYCPDNVAIHNLKIMNLKSLKQVMIDAGLDDIRVGGDGGTQLHLLISRRDLASKVYKRLGRIWNAVAVAVPPQLGWHSYLWAIGKVR